MFSLNFANQRGCCIWLSIKNILWIIFWNLSSGKIKWNSMKWDIDESWSFFLLFHKYGWKPIFRSNQKICACVLLTLLIDQSSILKFHWTKHIIKLLINVNHKLIFFFPFIICLILPYPYPFFMYCIINYSLFMLSLQS